MTTNELAEVFATNLKALRKQRNLTMAELGKRLGVSHVAISNIESGKSRPSLDMIAALAAALHVQPDSLLRPEISAALVDSQ